VSPVLRRRKRSSVSARRFAVQVGALVLLLVVGIAGVVLGVLVQSTPERRDAVELAVGGVHTVPQRVPFVGDVVVYGTPPEGERPDLDELGCSVTQGGGPLSTERARAEDRLVVDGAGLVPLVSFPGDEGHSIGCGGPAAQAAAPLYVVPGGNSRGLIPLAGYSVAVLAIPLAVLGLLYLRWSRV
jgi:hypothetical protein